MSTLPLAEFNNFVVEQISKSGIKKSITKWLINLADESLIAHISPINAILPSIADIFLASKSKKVCEYIVLNSELDQTDIPQLQEFIYKNRGKSRLQWKVDFAKKLVEYYKYDSEEDEQEEDESEDDQNAYDSKEDKQDVDEQVTDVDESDDEYKIL